MTSCTRAIALVLAAGGLAAPIIPVAPAFAGADPPIPLRVLTLNCLNGAGSTPAARAVLGGFCTILDQDGAGPNIGLQPDIVALQELDETRPQDLTDFRNTYLPNYQILVATGDGFNYNAMLVRPDITVLSSQNIALGAGAPRRTVKARLSVPGAARTLVVYSAHLKAFGDAASQATRRGEAQAAGVNISDTELNPPPQPVPGGWTPPQPPPDPPPVNVVYMGDLNSNNNNDGTLTPLLLWRNSPGIFTGMSIDLQVESLAGAANPGVLNIATFPGSGSRLDYVCLDPELRRSYDTNLNGSLSQDEINAAGFVYYSNEDGGLRSNGNASATSLASDHRPIVVDLRLTRTPGFPFYVPADANEDGSVSIEDLYRWEQDFVLTAPPLPSPAADIDGDRNIDPEDRASLRGTLRAGEVASSTTLIP